MADSSALLREYVRDGSEVAFAKLVECYLGLVYSTALRLVRGDAHLAQDVSQTVFIRLARRARGLPQRVALGGWLHRDACYVAATMMRSERRRLARETEAAQMGMLEDQTAENLRRIAPILDEVINRLGAADRTAIVLRFFEQCNFRSIAAALGTTDDSAQKRVTRAVGKLHNLLTARGVSLSFAALGAVLTTQGVAGVPAGLSASIAGTAVSSSATGGVLTLFKVLFMTKTKIGIAGTLVLVGVGVVMVQQHKENAGLKGQLARPEKSRRAAEAARPANLAALQRFDWRQVESTDYRTYIANLRAIGCPEQTIRDIIVADLNTFFDEKEKQPLSSRVEFWKTGTDPKDVIKEQLINRHSQLETERTGMLKELLGSDGGIDRRPTTVTDAEIKYHLLDFLPPAERTKALAVIGELDSAFETEFKPLLDEDRWDESARDEFAKFCREKDQKLLAALGPEAKENYELRERSLTTQVSSYLRGRFDGLEFSEAEFRELYRFAKPCELLLTGVYLDMNHAAQVETNKAAQRAIWDKAKELIGDERFYAGVPPKGLRRFGINPYARPSGVEAK